MSLAIELLNLAESIALKAGSLLVNRPSKFDLDEKQDIAKFNEKFKMVKN